MSVQSLSALERAAAKRNLIEQQQQLYAAKLAEKNGAAGGDGEPRSQEQAEPAEPWVVKREVATHIPFDTAWLLAPTLVQLVNEVCTVTGWPAEFLVAPLLAICGSAIGTSRQLRINDLWSERSCLWVAAIGDPGSGKTPSLGVITKPLLAMQRQWHEDAKQAHGDYQTELECWEEQPKGKRGAKPEEPGAQRKAVVSDITIEALVNILGDNPRGVVLIRDELLGWLLSFNQYKSGGGADRQHWLSIYSGVDMLVERKGEAYSAFVHNPFVGIYGGIQPDKLPDLRRDAGDGLIDRFLVFYPHVDAKKTRKFTLPTEAIAAYRVLLQRLMWLEPGAMESGDPVPLAVNLSDAAFELFVQQEWQMKQLAADPTLPKALRNAYGKAGGHAARVALTLHQCQCADLGEKPSFVLTDDTILAAWNIVQCSANHLLRAFGDMTVSAADGRVERAVAWIERNGRTACARDLLTGKVVGVTRASEARELIKELGDRRLGVVSSERTGGWEQLRITLPANTK